MAKRKISSLVGLILLAACGGSDGGGADPRLSRLADYDAQRLRVLGDPEMGVSGMPLTPPDAVPSSGTVVFGGAASVQIEQPIGVLSLAGDVGLDISFAEMSAVGSVTNVFGEGTDGAILNYAGTIALVGTADAATFDMTYDGTLTTEVETLVFDGVLVTNLLGDPIAGFAAIDLEAEVLLSGTAWDGSVVLFGEGTVVQPPPPPTP